MASSKIPEHVNQNYITDNDEVDINPQQQPKKQLKAAFDLIHPTLEEELTKQQQEAETTRTAIEKAQSERMDKFKLLLYGGSLVGLIIFSYKRWLPLFRMPFF